MTYNIGQISREELDVLATAMDYLLCNSTLSSEERTIVESLFLTLDIMSDQACDQESQLLIEKTNNLLVVDFTPKTS